MFTVVMRKDLNPPITMRVNGLGLQTQIEPYKLLRKSEVPAEPWMDSRGWSRWYWTVMEVTEDSYMGRRWQHGRRAVWARTLDRVRTIKGGKATKDHFEKLWQNIQIDHDKAKCDPLGELRRQRGQACQLAQAFSQQHSRGTILAVLIEKVGKGEHATVRRIEAYENGRHKTW